MKHSTVFALSRGLALSLPLALACEPHSACQEDLRAQVLDTRVSVVVGSSELLAEYADDTVERERGWKHRSCDREALLLIPDQPGEPLPVWGCGLVDAIDAAFVHAGQVVALERLEPCPEPCSSCAAVGEQLPVDAVLELPADALDVQLGDAVSFDPPAP